MASVYQTPSVPIYGIMQGTEQSENCDTASQDNIPYHARENALPFTYGNVPIGFNTSYLKNMTGNERIDSPQYKLGQEQNTVSPSITRKNGRPSISASYKLLRKTPSREEFKDMLMQRKVNPPNGTIDLLRKLAEDETIQKDLGELHKSLNTSMPSRNEEQLRQTDIPDVKPCSYMKEKSPEPQLSQQQRSKTPTFPYIQKGLNPDRCISPYLTPKPVNTLVFDENSALQQVNRNLPQLDSINHTKEVEPHLVKCAKDFSSFWYKPNMTRDEAVELLRDAIPGTFLIRNSTTYRNAFGLVLRVAKPPHGVVTGPGYGDQLVRHFLLEPTTRGVCLMGCTNEPIFSSLSAFVYEHSINQMSLPCTLLIPDKDLLLISNNDELKRNQKQVLAQGAACNVLYLYQDDMESLTGDDAVRKAVLAMYSEPTLPVPLEVHFKISNKGITLTDNSRKKFFRRHYPAKNISHLCMDPSNHNWSVPTNDEGLLRFVNKSIFAFIARPLTGSKDNQCHIFCNLSTMQPASAIVSFGHKVLSLDKTSYKML